MPYGVLLNLVYWMPSLMAIPALAEQRNKDMAPCTGKGPDIDIAGNCHYRRNQKNRMNHPAFVRRVPYRICSC